MADTNGNSATQKVVSVFGSSMPQPDSEVYQMARNLGFLLAEAGFAVATGAYGGTMAAVSQGASEAGGPVIGVTCFAIEQYRPMPPNQWVSDEIRYETTRQRLNHLVATNDAMIALPGGIGTLSEVALAWSLIQVGEIEPRPLVLLGPTWRQTIQTLAADGFIRGRDMDLLYFATGPDTAVGYLRQSLREAS